MPSNNKRRRRLERAWAFLFLHVCSLPCGSSFSPRFPGRHHHSSVDTSPTAHLPAIRRQSSLDAHKNSGGKKEKGQRFAQTAHRSNSPGQFNPDRMWRNNKSIEQLEDRLTKRWGTDLSKWTAQDTEDEEEEDWFDDPTTEVSGEAPNFRARPVKDPWDDERKQKTSVFGIDSTDERDVVLARRARRNQEKLMKEESEKRTDDSDQQETRRNGIKVDDLISSRPVGGQGTLRQPDAPTTSPPFFFRQETSAQDVSRSEEVRDRPEPEQKRKHEIIPGIPMLDAEGNPVLLTLSQAEVEFEASLTTRDVDNEPDHNKRKTDTTSWSDLGIKSSALVKNLHSMDCQTPLSVQEKTCRSILDGNDVIVGTYTGSGKTLAFAVPIVERLLSEEGSENGGIQALILAPGRELASQVVTVVKQLLDGTGHSAMLAIGGTTFSRNLEQIRKRKPSVLVGTPGRLAELVVGRPGERGGRLKIGGVHFMVLDEFDALLEYKPHREPTNAIIQYMKQRRGDRLQSILCSATASDLLGSTQLSKYLRPDYSVAMADKDDILVTGYRDSGSSAPATRVSRTVIHGVVHVPHRRLALENLRRILHTKPIPQQILIFAENARKVDIVVEKLGGMGIIAAPLHGGRGSEKQDRAEVSKALREGYVGIVVATELAARGLDAPLLTHVINLDLPTDASHYSHRAGRCGRGGRPGVVINITTSPQERNVPRKFADMLGIQMHTVEPRDGKLKIVDPDSVVLD